MPIFTDKVRNNQIIIQTAIYLAFEPQPEVQRFYSSLLDTGAQLTLISNKVVQELGLSPVGQTAIMPASGETILTYKYLARIDIPIMSRMVFPDGKTGSEPILRGIDMEVSGLPYQPQNHDVLLGMDFLKVIHFTMCSDTFIISI